MGNAAHIISESSTQAFTRGDATGMKAKSSMPICLSLTRTQVTRLEKMASGADDREGDRASVGTVKRVRRCGDAQGAVGDRGTKT